MSETFHLGYNAQIGWSRLAGPMSVDPLSLVVGFGIDGISVALGFIGHQRGYPGWQVFVRPPGTREVWGVLLLGTEYARLAYDPFKAGEAMLAGDLDLTFLREAITHGIPRRALATGPVPVDSPA